MIKYNIASINCCTEIEGPYKRLAIWFQGCNINCKGCCNPDYQPLISKFILTLDEVIEIIKNSKEKYGIEGVTYSGGEPTLQQNLPMLTEKIKELDLGIISFTGRKYEDVTDQLAGCDSVIDGAFIESKIDNNRKIIGSYNQRILCLTDRYNDIIHKWFMSSGSKEAEINISKKIVMNGDVIK